MKTNILFLFFLVHIYCFAQADTIITETFVQKKITYEFNGDTYVLKTKSVGNFIVHDGRRFYTYDTLSEFMLEKGDLIKYVAITTQNKIAMQGQFKVVIIGQTKSMQKSGKWKYYDQFGKLILTRKEKFRKPNTGSTRKE